MNKRDEKAFGEDEQELDLENREQDLSGAFLPVGGPLETPARETASEEAFHDEDDSDSPENDDALLSGRSPEFEHLTKPDHSKQ